MAATASNTFSDNPSNLGLRVEEEPAGLFDYRRNALSETIITTIVALLVLVLVYSLLSEDGSIFVTSIALAGLVTVAFATIRYTLSPDRLRAVQTKSTLSLASRTLEYMRGGLSCENCQEVCSILLPETQAMAVAMTDDSVVMGYAGRYAEAFPIGSPIHTAATHRVLETQAPEVFWSPGAIGMRDPSEEEAKAVRRRRKANPAVTEAQQIADKYAAHNPTAVTMGEPVNSLIPAGIVAPLIVRGVSVGTLKLYYEAPHLIDETQRAIAEGLAELLSTQLSIAELDRQVELATKAELQALQSQINPHFLFNTINTIASLIRTDPTRARGLLREFAVFYRQTLENSNDLIPLERENPADRALPQLRGGPFRRGARPHGRRHGRRGPERCARALVHHPAHRGELGQPCHEARRGAPHQGQRLCRGRRRDHPRFRRRGGHDSRAGRPPVRGGRALRGGHRNRPAQRERAPPCGLWARLRG